MTDIFHTIPNNNTYNYSIIIQLKLNHCYPSYLYSSCVMYLWGCIGYGCPMDYFYDGGKI